MPFKSEAQRRWMWANKPEMARQWQSETPKGSKLPERAGDGEMKKSSGLVQLLKQAIAENREFDRDRDPQGLPYRPVAEAMLFRPDGRVLANVIDRGDTRYYKFPGGGIDEGEDPEEGLRRELMEEVGADPEQLEQLEQLDWDWWRSWPKSEKQKRRFMQFRGEGSHQFAGRIGDLADPTSEEGDAWTSRPFQDPQQILQSLKDELPTLPEEQRPYRELQIRALKQAMERYGQQREEAEEKRASVSRTYYSRAATKLAAQPQPLQQPPSIDQHRASDYDLKQMMRDRRMRLGTGQPFEPQQQQTPQQQSPLLNPGLSS